MRQRFPVHGRSSSAVLDELRSFKSADCDWQHGRAPLFVFKATEEVYEVGRAAFFEYFTENALGAKRAFPSVKRMEEDVIAMALDLFSASADGQGFMTTGGTESIVQAVQTCRNWNRARRNEPRHRGNVVGPRSMHPAFDKAARLMDLEVRRIPVGEDYRADVKAIEAAIDSDTILLVGSAPCFPFGVIDPIEELAAVALRHDVWLHVDACVGGYVAPFARMIGRDIPNFDFGVKGVSSLSADLHKFGFCPKPASTVFYASAEKAGHHHFDFNEWPNGRFLTSTISGTRPSGAVAAAWAVFNLLGIEGYKRIARDLMDMVDRYKAGVEGTSGLRILGAPHLSIVAFGSDEIDVFRVAEVMAGKGWLPGLLQEPKGIHRMMSMVHADSNDEYIADLRAAVGIVRQEAPETASLKATY
ncbi:MAG: aminotransferase class V-fold PLP-dependent enzyme [Hyphomicrobiaceae bacterium]